MISRLFTHFRFFEPSALHEIICINEGQDGSSGIQPDFLRRMLAPFRPMKRTIIGVDVQPRIRWESTRLQKGSANTFDMGGRMKALPLDARPPEEGETPPSTVFAPNPAARPFTASAPE
jgi:hypothetical protein